MTTFTKEQLVYWSQTQPLAAFALAQMERAENVEASVKAWQEKSDRHESERDSFRLEADRLREKGAWLQAEVDVLRGKACAEEQAAGNGPCGACRTCRNKRIAELEAAEARHKREVIEARIDELENATCTVCQGCAAPLALAAWVRRGEPIVTTETQETEPASANRVPNRQGVPTSGTIPPETGTDAPEYLTDRDPGDEQP